MTPVLSGIVWEGMSRTAFGRLSICCYRSLKGELGRQTGSLNTIKRIKKEWKIYAVFTRNQNMKDRL